MDIKSYIKGNEGCRLEAYRDTAGLKTIGYGHRTKFLNTITQRQAEDIFETDLYEAMDDIKEELNWATALPEPYWVVLVDMCFNLGIYGLLQFDRFLDFVHTGKYLAAADDLEQTLLAHEVPARAKRNAAVLRTAVVK